MNYKNSRLILFPGIGFLLIWGDVFIGHFGGELRHWQMWLPLVFLPCAFVGSLLYAFRRTRLNQIIFSCICLIAIVMGILGFSFHLLKLLEVTTGVIQWKFFIRLMRNPPLLAPLAISGMGILGVLIDRGRSSEKTGH